MRKKYFKLTVSFVLFWHILYSAVFPVALYAQEIIPEESPAPVENITVLETPSETPTEVPSPTPIPSPDQSLATGDSVATADSLTESNISESTSTPEPTPIESDSVATDSATVEESSEIGPEAVNEPNPLNVVVDQTAVASSETEASADSGNNSQTGADSAVASTGDALSSANSIIVTNLAEVNSNLITTIQNVLTSDADSVDLYQLLEAAIAANPNFVPENANITTDQNGVVSTDTVSGATSGENTQEAEHSAMTTGDAVALANAINAVNFNLVGSNTVIAIINILADWNGNIILPNGTQMYISDLNTGTVNLLANQNAVVTSDTSASSDSGNNTQSGVNTYMSTGDAASVANSGNFVNIIQIGNGLGFLIINNGGNWNGNLINWSAPGSVETLSAGNSTLSTIYGESEGTGGGDLNIVSNQNAYVDSDVSASAVSGGNTQTGRTANLNTGNAVSFANNFTLANLTSIGGGLFFGIINIFSNWRGNIITAYPQLNVTVSDNRDSVNPGEIENYSVTLTNSGHSKAHGVNLTFNFPNEVTPEGTQNTSWNLGDLDPGQSQTFSLTGRVSGSAAGGTQLLASANATTADTQDSTSGNTATDSTNVVISVTDTRTPDLKVETWENVETYVNPGDTVLARITVYNQSPFIARNVELKGSLTDDNETTSIPFNWNLGDIAVNGKTKVSFDVTIEKDSLGGTYHLSAYATGKADSGDSSSSNTSVSDFLVKGANRVAQFLAPPVLGATIDQPENTDSSFNVKKALPYILPLIAVLYTILILGRRMVGGQPILIPLFAKKKKTSKKGESGKKRKLRKHTKNKSL